MLRSFAHGFTFENPHIGPKYLFGGDNVRACHRTIRQQVALDNFHKVTGTGTPNHLLDLTSQSSTRVGTIGILSTVIGDRNDQSDSLLLVSSLFLGVIIFNVLSIGLIVMIVFLDLLDVVLHVEVVQSACRFVEDARSPVGLVDDETVSGDTVVGHAVPLFLNTGKGKNVRNSVGVKPNCAISAELSDPIGRGHSRVTVDTHRFLDLANVREQIRIVENVNGGLVVEENPRLRHAAIRSDLESDSVIHEREAGFVTVIELSIRDPSHKKRSTGLGVRSASGAFGCEFWTIGGIVSLHATFVASHVSWLRRFLSVISICKCHSVGCGRTPSSAILLLPVGEQIVDCHDRGRVVVPALEKIVLENLDQLSVPGPVASE